MINGIKFMYLMRYCNHCGQVWRDADDWFAEKKRKGELHPCEIDIGKYNFVPPGTLYVYPEDEEEMVGISDGYIPGIELAEAFRFVSRPCPPGTLFIFDHVEEEVLS